MNNEIQNKFSKRILVLIVAVVCFVILSVSPITSRPALAQLPFGGIVSSIQTCNSGLLVYVLTPLSGLIPFMWLSGNLPYLMYVAPHPGQNVLGMATTATIPCVLGINVVGAGFPILYHGESL